jgi:hypothetical protein
MMWLARGQAQFFLKIEVFTDRKFGSAITPGILADASAHSKLWPGDRRPGSFSGRVAMSALGGEGRRSKRKPFDYVAGLLVGDSAELLPCQVADISDGGARLVVFSDTEQFPETLTLVLSSNGQVRRRCKVAWRRRTEIGVQFLKAVSSFTE